MDYSKILQQAIDLHVHIGPEIIPRKFLLAELLKYEEGKLKGVGVKNHFFSTVVMNTDSQPRQRQPFVIHSVVLNNYVGGFNPAAIRASAELSNRPIIVWFPTLHAQNSLEGQQFEIPTQWVAPNLSKKLQLRPTKNIQGLSVLDNGTINKKVKDTLKAIKEYGAILATGHISWQESKELVRFAIEEIGLKKVIITHPIYPKIDMPVEVQKELAKLGAIIEHCFSMYSIDKIPISKIVEQIRYVGANNCILSSDVGQTFSKSPSEALFEFASLLEKERITKEEISAMLVDNPNVLVS
ncbi:MAG: hypothetical protein HQ536_01930 [Parcubacteria group bacterium]|nr:hypothetical protein [Parcubacteria group bacterium]